jgi:hypothetical protein
MNKLVVVTYPDAPGYRVPGTSRDAAEAVAPIAARLRSRVLAGFREAPEGMTADEMAANLNLSVLAVRPRCSELVRLGELRRTAERRKNSSGMSAAVLVVSEPLPGIVPPPRPGVPDCTSTQSTETNAQLAMNLDGHRS